MLQNTKLGDSAFVPWFFLSPPFNLWLADAISHPCFASIHTPNRGFTITMQSYFSFFIFSLCIVNASKSKWCHFGQSLIKINKPIKAKRLWQRDCHTCIPDKMITHKNCQITTWHKGHHNLKQQILLQGFLPSKWVYNLGLVPPCYWSL